MAKNAITAIVIGVAVVLIIGIILLASSFSYLEYYEFGFHRKKSTGKVDTTEVYSSGRYALGPDAEFKVFPAEAIFETLKDAAVFTKDKLEIKLTVHFQYFLRKEDLNLLHKDYNLAYEPVVRSKATDALKGATTVYETNEFISQRATIENSLYTAVKDRLEGVCCFPNCVTVDRTHTTDKAPTLQAGNICRPNCKLYSSCEDKDKGLYVEIRYFELTEVDLPAQIEEKFMKALTLQEDSDREKFVQDAALVLKQTDLEVKQIENQALEVAANATAQSSLVRSRATANATAIIETARMAGLNTLFNKVKITSTEHKSSFDYLRSLKDLSKAHLAVDFNQLIVGPMKAP